MFEMKRKSATKIGVAMTSIVLLAACSHSAVQTEAVDENPAPITDVGTLPTPEPEAAPAQTASVSTAPAPVASSTWGKKKKKKVRYVKHAKKAHRKVVRHNQKKKDAAPAVTAQVNETLPPAPPAPPIEIQQAAPVIPPPPAFDAQALANANNEGGGLFSHWGLLLALV